MNEERLANEVKAFLHKHQIAGMSVGVTDASRIIYSQGFGFENAMRPEVPTHPHALYKIASMTKTITAVMILRLCEAEILDLDTPIGHYLPDLTLNPKEAAEVMTLRHLLTHTAGMPGDTFLEEGPRDEEGMDAEIKKQVESFTLSSMPGDNQYCYSSWGYNLIGLVASTVTQTPLSKLVAEYVLDPLGMEQTTFDYQVASTYPLSLPHLHNKEEGGLDVWHHQRINTAYHAGAGLWSNISDMCRFLRFLLNNGRADSKEVLLSEKSFKDMLAKHIEKSNAPGMFYGLGVSIRPLGDRFIYGHLGNYHPYNSTFFADYKTGLGVVTLMNTHLVPEERYTIPEMIFNMMSS